MPPTAPLIKALFNYAATQLSLTKSDDWHYGHIPGDEDIPDNCSALIEGVSLPQDAFTEDERIHRYQIYTRGTDYETVELEAHRIYDFLYFLRGVQLGDSWFLYSSTGTGPRSIGKDENARFAFSASITCRARKQ